jgi:NAD(P)H-flavin reductase
MPSEQKKRTSRPLEIDGLLLPNLFRVESRRRETADTFTLTLTPTDYGMQWPFAPGQFNMLTAFGIGEVPISISGDPTQPQTLIHTIRNVGAATRSLCGLGRGDILGVRGPFGTAWPVAAAEGQDLARTPGDILYYRELEGWRGRFDVRVHVTVDTAHADWRGRVGVVTKVMSHARFDPAHTTALVCGPGVMMRFTVQELISRGVSPDNIFVSMERNMQCGMGLCGHCQLGPLFICKDGPVFPFTRVKEWFEKREV